MAGSGVDDAILADAASHSQTSDRTSMPDSVREDEKNACTVLGSLTAPDLVICKVSPEIHVERFLQDTPESITKRPRRNRICFKDDLPEKVMGEPRAQHTLSSSAADVAFSEERSPEAGILDAMIGVQEIQKKLQNGQNGFPKVTEKGSRPVICINSGGDCLSRASGTYDFSADAFFTGVRTALVAFIAFMPTKAEGALGSLEYPKDERHALAIKSREAPPKFGNSDRQKLIDEIHEYMLSKVPPQPPISPKPETTDEQIDVAEEEGTTHAEQAVVMAPAAEEPNADAPGIVDGHRMVEDVREVMVEDVRAVRMDTNAGPLHVSFTAGLRVYRRVPASAEVSEPQHRPQPRAQNLVDDRWLTWLAIGLLIVIMALVLKKYMRSAGLANDGDEL